MVASDTWTSISESHGSICPFVRACICDGASATCTFWFHHHPRSVPCIIQVSAPMSAIVERNVCMRAVRCGSRLSLGTCLLANLAVVRKLPSEGSPQDAPAVVMWVETSKLRVSKFLLDRSAREHTSIHLIRSENQRSNFHDQKRRSYENICPLDHLSCRCDLFPIWSSHL